MKIFSVFIKFKTHSIGLNEQELNLLNEYFKDEVVFFLIYYLKYN